MTDATTIEARITDFATAVRQHLDDLPADEVDDLTDGLEADLRDQAADGDDRLALEDPGSYADELRASAGLPERTKTPRISWDQRVRVRLDRFRHTVGASRAGAWLLEFIVTLRPVWWVFRGWAVYQLVTGLIEGPTPHPMPTGMLLWSLLLASVIVSVQWGRGKWAPGRLLPILRTAVSVVAIVAAPFLTAWAISQATAASLMNEPTAYPPLQGLVQDGERVSNIFAYDADGNPLADVQLFDQDGNPLVTVGAIGTTGEFDRNYRGDSTTIRHPGSPPGAGWNIYPLQQAPRNDSGTIDPLKARTAAPPFRTTYPVPNTPTTTSPTPSPSPTPATTPGPERTPAP